MNNLKKKISVILFEQQMRSPIILFFPSCVKSKLFLQTTCTVKYFLIKNTFLKLDSYNLIYSAIESCSDLTKHLLLNKTAVFGVKIKNLFLSSGALPIFLNYISSSFFMSTLNKIYYIYVAQLFKFFSKKKCF